MLRVPPLLQALLLLGALLQAAAAGAKLEEVQVEVGA
jgi:hypothetical protein